MSGKGLEMGNRRGIGRLCMGRGGKVKGRGGNSRSWEVLLRSGESGKREKFMDVDSMSNGLIRRPKTKRFGA